MFKVLLVIHVLLFTSLTLKSQHVDSNLVLFETYNDFLEGKPMDLKSLAYIKKENDEWIEIEKLAHAKTLKKIRKADKIWAFKYRDHYYLNSYCANAGFSHKWFFYKVDSITFNSIFIIIDVDMFHREGFSDVSYSSISLVDILDQISGLNHNQFIDTSGQKKVIFFISKKIIQSKSFNVFGKVDFWSDKYLVTARFINYGELVALSNQHKVALNKISNKELDELAEVLTYLDNLP